MTNLDGCSTFLLNDFHQVDIDDPYFLNENMVVLVDRGGCTFVQKAENIQKFGALAALIVDNIKENTESILMSDANNKGEGLHIPTYLISYEDGEQIKKVINEEDDIMIRVSLEIGNDDNEVEYDLWYAGAFDFIHHDINQIKKVYQIINETAEFTPRIFTYSCVGCSEAMKEEYCISNGSYCPFWPHIEHPYKINQTDMKLRLLNETIREKCLY